MRMGLFVGLLGFLLQHSAYLYIPMDGFRASAVMFHTQIYFQPQFF